MGLLPGFKKQYDDPETGCHATDETALQSCREAYFLNQQNQIIQQEQAGGTVNSADDIRGLEGLVGSACIYCWTSEWRFTTDCCSH
jgi:hypothetical protein